MDIGYCLQGYPVKSQTWIPLEIQELNRRGHRVFIIDIQKKLNPKIIKNCDFILCHFSYQGIHARRWGVPYGILPHAYDIWKDKGAALHYATKSNNCKFVGCDTNYHKMKYNDWRIKKPLFDCPVCCDTEFFKKSKKDLGDKVIAGGRNTEKKGLKYAVNFKNLYLYGGKNKQLLDINPNINYMGWLDKNELRDLLNDAWLYVSPNVKASNGDMDGQCTTIKESLLMELQVLTTDIAGNREYKYVHFSDVDDILKAEDGEEYKKIVKENNKKGREYVLNTFSPKICIDKYLEAIESVLG